MRSLPWKRLIGKLYSIFLSYRQPKKIILLYHAVGTGPWAMPEDNFKKQIQWLKHHCNIVSLETLLNDNSHNKKTAVAITFDDGYACLYHTVFPILQSENAMATIYLNTDWISENNHARKKSNPILSHYPQEEFLIWPEVKVLEQSEWIIGSHGANHLDFTKQPNEVILSELKKSKKTVEMKLQKPCTHFAYTFGNHSKRLRNLVGHVGYRYAVTGQHTALKYNSNKMMLPRINIEIGYSLSDFENIMLGKWDFLGTIHRIRQMRNK